LIFDKDKEIQEWLSILEPKVPREGEFREEHVFDKTKEKYVVIFTCERNLKGGFNCSTLGIEKKRQ
jgi:hypothetical protein